MIKQTNLHALLTASVGLAALGCANSAFAAEGVDQNRIGASRSDQGSDDAIVVIARKRVEDVGSVPVSIGVATSEALERMGIVDVADLTRVTPGAVLIASGPEYLNDIALRGQGGGRLGFSESSTGIYRDGVFVAGGGFGGRTYSQIDFFDLDRTEVYRGPQGALYGRNSVGGAVNVITRRPVIDTQVRAKVGYDSVDNLSTEAIVNVPLSDHFAVRIGGYRERQTGGHYTSDATGTTIDTQHNWGIRGAVGAGLGTDTNAYLTVEHSRSKGPGFTVLGRNVTLDPDPFVRTQIDVADRVIIDQTSVLGEFHHDFGGTELTALANYKNRDGRRTNADFDHFLGVRNAGVTLYDAQGEAFAKMGGEVRLNSAGDGPLNWLFGVDYSSYESEVYSNRTGTVVGTGATFNAYRRQLRRQESTENLESYSAFGLIGYDLTERLNLSVEARYQVDKKNFRFKQIDLDPTTNETIALTTFERKWERFLPTASINYKVGSDLSLFARVATGYRAGGFNNNPAPGFFNRVPYDPEDATNGELGIKSNFRIGDARFRFNASVYHTWTRDVQQTTTLTVINPTFTLENAGDNKIYGGEAELSGTIPFAGGRVLVSASYSGSRGTWDDGASIIFNGAVFDLSGLQTPRSRDYSINLVGGYSHLVGPDLDLSFNASFQTAGGGFDNANLARASESYAVLNLNAGIAGKNWNLRGFIKNVTNDVYVTVQVSNNNYYNIPRSYGVSFGLEF